MNKAVLTIVTDDDDLSIKGKIGDKLRRYNLKYVKYSTICNKFIKNYGYAVILFKLDNNKTLKTIKNIKLCSPSTRIIIFDTIKNCNIKLSTLLNYSSAGLVLVNTKQEKQFISGKSAGVNVKTIDDFIYRPESRERKNNGLISIITLCYNQIKYTKKCLRSIFKYSTIPYELIIVNNNSNDGTNEYLAKLKGIKVINNKTNLGFSKGCNQGIKAAKGKYIVLLNNDTLVTPNWLEKMLLYARARKDIGIVGPSTNSTYGIQCLDKIPYNSVKDMIKWSKINSLINYGEWKETKLLSGFCMLIKKEVINKIGFFDTNYGLGCFEDYDFCKRAKEAGFKLIYAKDVFIHHYGNASFTREIIIRQHQKNSKYFKKKWH